MKKIIITMEEPQDISLSAKVEILTFATNARSDVALSPSEEAAIEAA